MEGNIIKLLAFSFTLLKLKVNNTKNLKEAVKEAFKDAKKGDVILFSPAFASFGLFVNEYDRGDQFVRIVKKL